MPHIQIEFINHEVSEAVANAHAALQQRFDDAQARIVELESDVEAANVRLDAEQASFTTAVQGRVALERAAVRVLGENQRFDAFSDRELRERAIRKVNPNARFDGRDDSYVEAQFDTLIVDGAGKVNLGILRVQEAINRGDEARADSARAQQRGPEGDVGVQARLDAAERKLASAGKPTTSAG